MESNYWHVNVNIATTQGIHYNCKYLCEINKNTIPTMWDEQEQQEQQRERERVRERKRGRERGKEVSRQRRWEKAYNGIGSLMPTQNESENSFR